MQRSSWVYTGALSSRAFTEAMRARRCLARIVFGAPNANAIIPAVFNGHLQRLNSRKNDFYFSGAYHIIYDESTLKKISASANFLILYYCKIAKCSILELVQFLQFDTQHSSYCFTE